MVTIVMETQMEEVEGGLGRTTTSCGLANAGASSTKSS